MDEDADASVGEFLRSRGHIVQFSRIILWTQAADHIMAARSAARYDGPCVFELYITMIGTMRDDRP